VTCETEGTCEVPATTTFEHNDETNNDTSDKERLIEDITKKIIQRLEKNS
jgi:hypothetical protein